MAVAVVVDPVAQLVGVRVHGRVGVVAVQVVAHPVPGLGAGHHRVRRVAVAVAVGVGVPGARVDGVVLVHVAVTVVVLAVAVLVGARVLGRIAVVAVVVGERAGGPGAGVAVAVEVGAGDEPPHQVGLALGAVDEVGVGRADQQVVGAVGVHVARGGEAAAGGVPGVLPQQGAVGLGQGGVHRPARRVPVHHEGLAALDVDVAGVGAGHGQVVVAVAVHVAGARHRAPAGVVDPLAQEGGVGGGQRGVHRPAAGGAQDQVALARLPGGLAVVRRADQDVVVAVVVHVAGPGHVPAGVVVPVLAQEGRVGAPQPLVDGPPGGPPADQVGLPRVVVRVVVAVCADEDVVVAVAVHVAGDVDAPAGVVVPVLSQERGVGVLQLQADAPHVLAPEHQVDLARVLGLVVVVGGADQDVVVAVAVDVAPAGHLDARLVAVGLAHEGGAGQPQRHVRGQGVHAAEQHVGLAGVVGPVVAARCADHQVVVAVAVQVAGQGDSGAGVVVIALAVEGGVGAAQGGAQGPAPGLTQDQVGLAGPAAPLVVLVGPDQEVVVAVSVDVPAAGDRVARLVAPALAQVGGVRAGQGGVHAQARGRGREGQADHRRQESTAEEGCGAHVTPPEGSLSHRRAPDPRERQRARRRITTMPAAAITSSQPAPPAPPASPRH